MSSSRAPKVIMGSTGTSLDETSLEALQGGRSARAWDPHLEEEYWKRIREKAEALAMGIVAKAQVEAAQLKAKALEEGYAEGAQMARAELEAHLAEMGSVFGSVMANVDAQAAAAWQASRQDIVTLVRMAVEKTIRVELDSRRTEVMGSLLDQSLDLIDSRKELTIRVNPQDEPLMAELLARAQANHPGLERWRVKASPDIARGGLILESDQGMVDNTIPSRFADVAQILDQIDIGDGQGA